MTQKPEQYRVTLYELVPSLLRSLQRLVQQIFPGNDPVQIVRVTLNDAVVVTVKATPGLARPHTGTITVNDIPVRFSIQRDRAA